MWGYRHAADTRLVNVHVQRLRSKVEHDPENPEIVVTVRGVGYKAGTALMAGRSECPRRSRPRRGLPARRSRSGAAPSRRGSWSAPSLLSARGRQRGRLVPAPADPRRASLDAPGRRSVRRGERRDAPRRQRPARRRARHRPRRRPPASRPGRPDHRARRALRGFSVVLSGPVAGSGDRIAAGGGTRLQPRAGHRAASRTSLRAALRGRRRPTAWTYTDDPQHDGDADGHLGARASSSARRCRLPADGGAYTLYYLFPLDEEQETLALVTRALLTAGGAAARAGGRADLAGHPAGRHARSGWPAGWPSGWRPGSSRSGCRCAARTTSPGWRRRSTRWPRNLQRQIRQLEELSRVQRRFVSDVSHELRTPLTTVRMASDVLHDARDRLRPGHRPGRRAAADRARPLRDPARRPAGDQPLRRRRRGPRRSRTSTWSTSPTGWSTRRALLADQRGVAVVVEAPDRPCLAEADVRRVERIVRNLVTNAIDHAESGGRRDRDRRRRRHAAARRRPRLRRRPGAGRVGDGVQPVLARRPGPGPDQRRHRAGPVDLARGHPPARRLAAGLGPSPARARSSGSPCPARGRRPARRQPAAAGARRTPAERVGRGSSASTGAVRRARRDRARRLRRRACSAWPWRAAASACRERPGRSARAGRPAPTTRRRSTSRPTARSRVRAGPTSSAASWTR